MIYMHVFCHFCTPTCVICSCSSMLADAEKDLLKCLPPLYGHIWVRFELKDAQTAPLQAVHPTIVRVCV